MGWVYLGDNARLLLGMNILTDPVDTSSMSETRDRKNLDSTRNMKGSFDDYAGLITPESPTNPIGIWDPESIPRPSYKPEYWGNIDCANLYQESRDRYE